MMDQQLKRKVVKTITQYEQQYDKLQMEVNALKGTLNELSLQALKETAQLESGIKIKIKQIKKHITHSDSIEDLAHKIQENLVVMEKQLKDYKANEQKRWQDNEQKMMALEEKLIKIERKGEEIKNLLSNEKINLNRDSLTGLPNRTLYCEYISYAYYRWQRGFGDLSLALADIDHFREINEKYGHLTGDRILQEVATIFKTSIRRADFLARYSGEKFIFIFERTQQKDAAMVLESLRRAIEECQFFHDKTKIDVTVSFGLTTLTQGDELEGLLIRADKAVYQAKMGGRNQVTTL
ncbi:TPA: GGDEF domain-containing protein [Legionella feeleii]